MKLKIFKQNPWLVDMHPTEVMAKDFTILNGITKGKPNYKNGIKISSGYYIDNEQNDLAILKTFEDVIDEKNEFIGVKISIEWIDEQNNTALRKKIFVSLSKIDREELIAKRKKREKMT